ncbi:MAG: YbaN family protein [Clostridia bacterium]|nr:YbaN family protein [Clostridia bacterium]MBQ8332724.1 YbaN family protein [Clostridia bacterium]MBQ8513767.1 YbaN family protein [Clostridia bacterium]
MTPKKILFITAGVISAVLGTLGTFLPLLPTVPLYLLAAVCFAKSSERLHSWFTSTKIYRDNLEDYVKNGGMTKKVKLRIMLTVTAVMTVSFFMMHSLPAGRIVLGVLWIVFVLFFLFGIRTLPDKN